jgi:hypothetical protein
VDKEKEDFMYRIVKRTVRTITTITLLVRWEASPEPETVEKQITLPSSHSRREEEAVDQIDDPKNVRQSLNPALDEGEKP